MHIVTAPAQNVATDSESLASDGWQQSLRDAIRSPEELCEILELPIAYCSAAQRAAESFQLFVPREYVAKIPPGDPEHPLLRQVLPLNEETFTHGFSRDPVGDGDAQITAGLLQKYASRALLVVTGVCAVHCRYCFRRYFPYNSVPKGEDDWQPAIDMIVKDNSLDEVILSGGDPWMLVDSRLQSLIDKIAQIPHIRRLRIHTRLPSMIPSRVTETLLRTLTSTRLASIVVSKKFHLRNVFSLCVALIFIENLGIPPVLH